MKNTISTSLKLVAAVLFSNFHIEAQQYYVGVPVNITIDQIAVADLGGCYPQYAGAYHVLGMVPYVTGLKVGLKIASMNAPTGSVTASPFGIIKLGDTLPVPSSSYQFYFSQGGNVSLDLIVYGIPQVANEQYNCNVSFWICTLPTCMWDCSMNFNSTCSVSTLSNVEDIDKNTKVEIYPNPSNGKFTIQTSNIQYPISDFEIYNVLGEKVYEQAISNKGTFIQSNPSSGGANSNSPNGFSLTPVDLFSQPSGIYFILLQTDKESFTQKLIIQQ